MINYSRWYDNYNALKKYVAQSGHFPSKHTKLNNWCRYQRKCINAGTMPEERRILFEELANNRMKKYNGRSGGFTESPEFIVCQEETM